MAIVLASAVIVLLVLAVAWVPAQGLTGQRGRAGDPGASGGGAPGAPGVDGFTALVATSGEPPGGNCAYAGQQVRAGPDDGAGGGTARDGILQGGEVDYLFYTCNGAPGSTGATGADGYNTIVKLTTESAGANCPSTGGKKVESGLDNGDGGGTSRNGVLEAGEVDVTTYVCNGLNGANGADGFNSLVTTVTEAAGANCPAGGFKVRSGLDDGLPSGTARNNVLEAGEVEATTYICSGTVPSLIKSVVEAVGANCPLAGYKVTSGMDNGDGGGTALNGVLEAGEVDATAYVCDGTVPTLILTTAEAQGANCGISGGGYKVTTGVDNGDGGGTKLDGILQAGEVDSTAYICFGGPGGGKIVYFSAGGGVTPTTANQWTNMPAAFTEFDGLTNSREYVNLSAFREVRFSVGVQVASAASAFLLVQYSTAASNGSAWTNLAGSQSPIVNIGSTGATKTTGWVTFNSSAQADVLLRIVGQNGDGALDPTFPVIMCEFR